MPSLADATGPRRLRRWAERAAHAIGIAIIAWLLVDSLRPDDAAPTQVAETASLPTELHRWSTTGAPQRVHLRVNRAVPPAQRDWLAALARAGSVVTWEGDEFPALALEIEPVVDPGGGTRVRAAAPSGTALQLMDPLGVIDSLTSGVAGVSFTTSSPLASAAIGTGDYASASAIRDTVLLGHLLIVGRVGWESGMVMGALEERGWAVDASLALSPRGDVMQGNPAASLDIDRYSAVLVFDTVAIKDPARLVRYVRDGGGLIVNARAAASPALAPLRPGRAGRVSDALEPFDTVAADPRRSLALTEIVPGPEAVALEERDGRVAVAARRVERGRVVALGYADTWRWRMAGGEGSPERHRAWWAGLVASVAHAERLPLPRYATTDEAPLVEMVRQLGEPDVLLEAVATPGSIPRELLFALLAAALLLHWLSRRLRGES